MGLAASQARLLSLTSRQHTIEHRAQVLQANKLRLANDSDAIYEKYINALDSTKLETRTVDSKGKVHWVDGSLDNLMRYNTNDKSAGAVYYAQDINSGKLYMPSRIVDAYDRASGDMFAFMDNLGIDYQKGVFSDDYYAAQALVASDISNGWDVQPYSDEFLDKYNTLKAKIMYPNIDTDEYKAAEAIFNIANYSQTTDGTVYVPWSGSQYKALISNLEDIKGTSYYNSDSNLKDIVDYCVAFDGPTDATGSVKDMLKFVATTEPNDTYYLYYDKVTEDTKAENDQETQDIFAKDANGKESDALSDLVKLKLLLNGGTWKKVHKEVVDFDFSELKPIYGDKEETGNVYNEDIKTTLNNYVEDASPNIGDALIQISRNIMDAEYDKYMDALQSEMDTLVANENTNQDTVERKMSNHRTYLKDLAAFESQDTTTHTEYADKVLGIYYENMFNSISAAGGCIEISDAHLKSADWAHNMIKSAQIILAVYNQETGDIDNTTSSSNPGIREVSNDAEIKKADVEYETALETINSKDSKYTIELNQLEEERGAIQTEIESLKKIAKENVESTFKLFS